MSRYGISSKFKLREYINHYYFLFWSKPHISTNWVSRYESPQNLSLDASSMKQIGEGHSTLSWCPNTILDIAHATGWIRHPYVDIQNLLQKLVIVQVELSQSEMVKFPMNKSTLIYCLLWPHSDSYQLGTTRSGMSWMSQFWGLFLVYFGSSPIYAPISSSHYN